MAYGDHAPFITPKGYVRVYEPEHPLANRWGHVMEHRKVAWDHGILTNPRDHVHHINENPADNRPENLKAMTRSAHAKLHGAERKRTPEQTQLKDRLRYRRRWPTKTCEVCGRDYQWRGGDADPRGCGNACRAVLRRRDGWRPAYLHDCEACGREFRSRIGDARFCGNKCRAAARWGNDPCTAGLPGGG